jgi:superfamily II DNA or RNA helicase
LSRSPEWRAGASSKSPAPAESPVEPPAERPEWRDLVDPARRVTGLPEAPLRSPPAELLYVVELEKMRADGDLVVALRTRSPRKSGWSKDKAASVPFRSLDLVSDARDRRALPLYEAAANIAEPSSRGYRSYGYGYGEPTFATEAAIPPSLAGELMPLLSDTGRLFLRPARNAALVPASYQGDPAWDFVLRVVRRPDGGGSEIRGCLQRGAEVADLAEPLLLTDSGWAIFAGRVARLRHFEAYTLLSTLRGRPHVALPADQERAFVSSLFLLPAIPRLELPAELSVREIVGQPLALLKVGAPIDRRWGMESKRPAGEVRFAYGDLTVNVADRREVIADLKAGHILRRDRSAEAAALRQLQEAGFERVDRYAGYFDADQDKVEIAAPRLTAAVNALVAAGWRVEAEGRTYRRGGRFALSVSSGVDWFDLDGRIDFDGVPVSLPELLRAIRRGEKTIVLDDGSVGMLPDEWLQRYGLLAEVGTAEGGRLRFAPAQVGLLDALLAAEPEVSVDRVFAKARDQLRSFDHIQAEAPPPAFRGELRLYQEVGLGWLAFLRRFGFGGCLADDMGLGKTVQVLAMLASRRLDDQGGSRAAHKPSLVVVPKSLVWNWQQEAARFVPGLRILAHVGPERAADAPTLQRALDDVDVVLTTYGLMRKDAAFLREIEMDYLILDEAQAIKNADSESAKAARLLRGDHRLALSGTPIENHIGELWSLIDFLNPGMLGASRVFAGVAGNRRPDREALAVLARALRPFILRRTKEQVAPELPPKHEEVIVCEMEPEQRRVYDELRTHYRAKLLSKIESEGLARSKLQVLEALLRLRQAACHPGLIDKERAGDGSAKLDVLFARLDEVRREGHKALVFSQFTSFLALVRARLAATKTPYEYLDGKTRDREACVRRFQTDPSCQLFLISLKAGGVGLNLTAADYVFILDPWWNPAVEAQAVDRAHRIGQDKHVFVYRLICRDTVEEKVVALQEQKRDLAAAIIDADGTLLQNLDRETLELLLG